MASCWRRARISAISSRRGAKKERAREKRRGKRAISEKQNREIQIQKWVSSIRGRSCKCKRLKVGWDFRYAQEKEREKNKKLVAQIAIIEVNAARLGIDPEELYKPIPKPIRTVSRAGATSRKRRF